MQFLQISDLSLSKDLEGIANKVLAGQRINNNEGVLLYQKAPLGLLGLLADHVRKTKNGLDTFFIRNIHIEPTNICIHHCRFCSYSARQTGNPWESTPAEMLDTVRNLEPNIREVHIVGGVHPHKDVIYYGELIRDMKKLRPDIYVKAYTAIELDFMIRKSGMSLEEGLAYLKDCGLDGLPGGGAEIFDEDIRKEVCDDKATGEEWLAIHEAAHRQGIPTNATILYGHIESYAHRIDHLHRLRELQDKTSGFNAFIPLKFKNQNNELSEIEEVSVIEDLKNYAISRIFLDNFRHIKAYWPMMGKNIAQLALSFGVDDLDGTINDSTKIYSLAGSDEQNPAMTATEMSAMITQAGYKPVERDGWYKPIS
jgi:aminodeoxyfutalosine synthase